MEQSNHQYFRNAKFAKSHAFLSPDENDVFHTWNVQFNNYPYDPNIIPDLKKPSQFPTNEQIAEKFGEFMKVEFLAAIQREEARKKKEWDEGEKNIKYHSGGHTISLVNESKPEYSSIQGEFTPIG